MFGKKRKKNLETSPLASYGVGRIKENKYWYVKLIIFFGFFIGIVFYLPQLNELYEKKLKNFFSAPTPGSNVSNSVGNNTTNTTTNTNTEVIEEKKSNFNDDTSVTVSNIVFSAVKLEGNKISFNAKNSLESSMNLDETNVYFEAYNSTDNLVKRYALTGDLLASETRQFSFVINGSANYYEIKEILEDDYTYINLSYDENDFSTLTCTKDNEKIVYTFKDEKLTRISHTDRVVKGTNDYTTKYSLYNDLYVKSNANTGITSTFSVGEEALSYKMAIDYTRFSSTINNKLYFAKDTSPRVVNFRVEAWEYECS